ncbi:MAG TPA: divalent metal cation transporter [Longimicrobiaceae bacterium]|nr:divalent metal cation transporter [Longimicrobiaceae bacterium]
MKPKKLLQVALGVLTSIGGFLDVGAIATAADAGASFRFRLLWVVALGTLVVIFLAEMVGRLAAVSKHAYADAVRERFGFQFYFWPLLAEFIVDFLVLGAEIGGVCIALQLLTGISFRWWAIPVAFAVWLTAWFGTFKVIENSVALLGLVTIAFVVGAFHLGLPWGEAGRGFIPSAPPQDAAHYWFVAVSIMGALVSPYVLYFYSSGAIEDGWGTRELQVNRLVATVGMGFGSVVQMGMLATAALVLAPRGISIDDYGQVALTLVGPFGLWGFYLFVASLGVTCFGACMEQGLETAYISSQAFGWNWGESKSPRKAARFSMAYTLSIFASSLIMLAGIDPLKLTMFSMALTALMLPLVIVPLLVIMNDRNYLGEHTNGWVTNLAVGLIIGLTFVLALFAIPLEYLGG